MRWRDAGLPGPECQIEVPAPNGARFFLRMGLREHHFGAEYDGEEFHGEKQQNYDEDRREWVCLHHGWTIVVARRRNVYGRSQDIAQTLRREFQALTLKSR